MLDVELPGSAVFADVQRLMDNLIAMDAILRDSSRCTIRLVMTPDKMVIGEAMRTFTYLNLYGYVTDAVIVNRVFPEAVGTYFGAWRERQREHVDRVRSAFSPVPVLLAPYFESEVAGPEMLDRLGESIFDGQDAGAVLHGSLAQQLEVAEHSASLRLELPFAERGDISLKKIGPGAGGPRRRPQAHDHAAARPGRVPPDRGALRDGAPPGDARWRRTPATPRTGPDPLDELGQRIRAAQEAAERVVAEATQGARDAVGERPPPRGYADDCSRTARLGAEAQALAALADLARGMLPPELRTALADLVRELLLLLRALIDWYLERVELRRRPRSRSRTSRSRRRAGRLALRPLSGSPGVTAPPAQASRAAPFGVSRRPGGFASLRACAADGRANSAAAAAPAVSHVNGNGPESERPALRIRRRWPPPPAPGSSPGRPRTSRPRRSTGSR